MSIMQYVYSYGDMHNFWLLDRYGYSFIDCFRYSISERDYEILEEYDLIPKTYSEAELAVKVLLCH